MLDPSSIKEIRKTNFATGFLLGPKSLLRLKFMCVKTATAQTDTDNETDRQTDKRDNATKRFAMEPFGARQNTQNQQTETNGRTTTDPRHEKKGKKKERKKTRRKEETRQETKRKQSGRHPH